MSSIAFLRNVTLGRQGGLSNQDVINLFMEAGAQSASSFLASGNIIFDAPSPTETGDNAVRLLEAKYDFNEPIFIRSIEELQTLEQAKPFNNAPNENVWEQCITFMPEGWENSLELPLVSPRQDVEVFKIITLHAFSITRMIHGRSGYATALLEKKLGIKITTRNWKTLLRVLTKFG